MTRSEDSTATVRRGYNCGDRAGRPTIRRRERIVRNETGNCGVLLSWMGLILESYAI